MRSIRQLFADFFSVSVSQFLTYYGTLLYHFNKSNYLFVISGPHFFTNLLRNHQEKPNKQKRHTFMIGREKCLKVAASKTSSIHQSLMKMRNLFGLSQASKGGEMRVLLLIFNARRCKLANIFLSFLNHSHLVKANKLFYFKTFTVTTCECLCVVTCKWFIVILITHRLAICFKSEKIAQFCLHIVRLVLHALLAFHANLCYWAFDFYSTTCCPPKRK